MCQVIHLNKINSKSYLFKSYGSYKPGVGKDVVSTKEGTITVGWSVSPSRTFSKDMSNYVPEV